MSIVTLKRKSNRYFKPVSKNGSFSINGGYRNQGWVGQTNIGRSSQSCCENDNAIIKSSNLNTNGYISSRLLNPTGCTSDGCRNIHYKNFTPFKFSAGEKIKWKKLTTLQCNPPWSRQKNTQVKSNSECNKCTTFTKDLNSNSYTAYLESKVLNSNVSLVKC